jgi:hypothetical protein
MGVSLRDCALAYLWNPFDGDDGFTYQGLSTTAYAEVNRTTRTATILFRGTDQLLDWVVNLCCLPWRLHGATVHGGFLLAWSCTRRRLLPWLLAHRPDFDRIVVTGHSLGGALATLAAHDLSMRGFDVERCVTVGAPRVFTKAAAAQLAPTLGQRVDRVCRVEDAVPTVPPDWLGFAHVGRVWDFLDERQGARVHVPRWQLEEVTAHLLHVFTLGPVGARIEAQLGESARVYATIGVLAVIGTLSTALHDVLGVLVFVVLIVGVLLTAAIAGTRLLMAHGARRYTVSSQARGVVHEWQAQVVRTGGAGLEVSPAGGEQVWLDVSVALPSSVSQGRKRRLVRRASRFLGGDAATTELATALSQATHRPDNGATAARAFGRGRPPPEGRRDALDRRFRTAVLLLRLHGFDDDELYQIVCTGRIGKPRAWRRFYAPTDPSR